MPAKQKLFNFLSEPVRLIILLTILQLLVTLLTDGFALSFDEAVWHYIGRNWLRYGLTPYTGGIDNKSPLIFLLYGLSDQLFGINYWFPRIIGTLCQSVGLYYVYKSANHLAGRTASIIALTIYGLSLLWHATGGKYTAHTETFAVTFIIISFYQFITGHNKKDLFISGLLAGIGIAFRYSAFFGVVAILVSLLWCNRKMITYFLLGTVVSASLFILFLYLCHINLHEFFFYSFTDNFYSGSITDHDIMWKLQQFTDKFFYSELILFYPALIGYFLLKKQNLALTLWLIFAFIGINVIGLYDGTHFKDLLPALSITNAISISYLIEKYKVSFKAVLLIIWLCFFPKLLEPLISLKKLFIHQSFTGQQILSDEESKKHLGLWVKAHTAEKDQVLILGTGAIIQVYSERLSPTVYFSTTQTPDAKSRWMNDINQNYPKLILIPQAAEYNQHLDKDIKAFIIKLISKNYQIEGIQYGYAVYRKTGGSANL
jgi:4-amino-4-deoxy-L-arabinose transferase-like glycosyltransferase